MKLPNRWKRGIVRDLIGSMDSGVSVNSEDKVSVGGEYGILKTSCVTSGIFDPNENKVIVNDEIDRAKVNPKRGRILMSRMNTSFLVGASAYVPNDYKNLFLPDRLWQIEPKDDRVDMKWLSYVLGSSKYRLKISSVANGTSGSMKNISKGDIEALNIFIPPFQEQGAIAELLSNWDSAIEKIVRLIITKENYFKELAHELIFNGSKGGKWKPVRLGEVFEERNEINHINLPLLSITRKKGIIPFDAAERKNNSNEDKTKYLRILPGDIGYNTMRMWQGVSALSKYEGIVSPAYTICVPKADIDGEFAAFLFKQPFMVHRFYRYSQGLTSDTWSLKFHHFSKIKTNIPEKSTQKEIATALNFAKKEVETQKRFVEKLQIQKHGLMEKLLPGTWQVRGSK